MAKRKYIRQDKKKDLPHIPTNLDLLFLVEQKKLFSVWAEGYWEGEKGVRGGELVGRN